MTHGITITLPGSLHGADLIAATEAAERAVRALEIAITEPGNSSNRCNITNALNYIDTIVRQAGAR